MASDELFTGGEEDDGEEETQLRNLPAQNTNPVIPPRNAQAGPGPSTMASRSTTFKGCSSQSVPDGVLKRKRSHSPEAQGTSPTELPAAKRQDTKAAEGL